MVRLLPGRDTLRELRRVVPLADLKEQGAFFTAPELAPQAATTFGGLTDKDYNRASGSFLL